jgi:hypothetical protein
MKKALALAIILMSLVLCLAPAWAAEPTPYSLKVKQLYAAPDGRSKVVFDIPVDVKLLDISEDANWYRVFIQFNLGPACFRYTGWAYIPVGTILAERDAKKVAILE